MRCSSVREFAVLALDSHLGLALDGLHPSHNLRVDVEALAHLDHLLRVLRGAVHLHAMPAVEHLVHLAPLRPAALVDQPEQRRHRQHVILDHVEPVHEEVANLALRAAGAVHHTVNVAAIHGIQQLLHHRRVGARR